MRIHDGQRWLLNAEHVSCYISKACYKCMVAKSVMHVLHHVRNILSTHAFMTVNCIPVLCVQHIVIMIKVPSAGFYRSSMVVTGDSCCAPCRMHVAPHAQHILPMHCPRLHPCPELFHDRYDNDGTLALDSKTLN